MGVGVDEVRVLLRRWCDDQQDVYAVIFEPSGLQSVSGRVIDINENAAIISDSFAQIHIPFAAASDIDLTHHNDVLKSITITFVDGRGAFIVTR